MDRVGHGGRKKKLEEAAAWWVNLPAAPAVDTVAEDMAALGVQGFEPPEWMQDELDDASEDHDFGVLPENEDAVAVFLACATQWLFDQGARTGLRYEAVEVVMRQMKVVAPEDVFARVRVMERAALAEFRRNAAAGA